MKANIKDKNKPGIYCIKNLITNKVYIGKSVNIFARIQNHICSLNKKDSRRENDHLINSWFKHGPTSFIYSVLEYTSLDENLLKEKELFWIEKLDSTNEDKGYNLRRDSATNMIVHDLTRIKISKRLKKEWATGTRSEHAKKLSKNWSENPDRKKEQSLLLTKTLTKYKYRLYTLEKEFIKEIFYKELKQMKLSNVVADFCTKKINTVKFKGFFIERIKTEDIVQSQ